MVVRIQHPFLVASLLFHVMFVIVLWILLPRNEWLPNLNIEINVSGSSRPALQQNSRREISGSAVDTYSLPVLRMDAPEIPGVLPQQARERPAGLTLARPESHFNNPAFDFEVEDLLLEQSGNEPSTSLSATVTWESGGDYVPDQLDSSDLISLYLDRPYELTIIFRISREGIATSVEGHITGQPQIDAALSKFLSKLTFRPAETEYEAVLVLRLEPGDAF